MKLTVDPRHWLDEHGNIPLEPARLRRNMLRIARIIEYGGPLNSGTMLETLIECSRKPKRKQCPGLLWVQKLEDQAIAAYCMICKQEEIYVHHWQDTEWADGPMEAVPVEVPVDPTVN